MEGTRLIKNICAYLDGLEDKSAGNFFPSKSPEYEAESCKNRLDKLQREPKHPGDDDGLEP